MIVSGLVLSIACANLANLLLARGAAAQRNSHPGGAGRSAYAADPVGDHRKRAARCDRWGSRSLRRSCRHAILLLAFRGSRFVPINATPTLTVLAFASRYVVGSKSDVLYYSFLKKATSDDNLAEGWIFRWLFCVVALRRSAGLIR